MFGHEPCCLGNVLLRLLCWTRGRRQKTWPLKYPTSLTLSTELGRRRAGEAFGGAGCVTQVDRRPQLVWWSVFRSLSPGGRYLIYRSGWSYVNRWMAAAAVPVGEVDSERRLGSAQSSETHVMRRPILLLRNGRRSRPVSGQVAGVKCVLVAGGWPSRRRWLPPMKCLIRSLAHRVVLHYFVLPIAVVDFTFFFCCCCQSL